VRVDEDRLRGGSVRFEDFAMAVRGALAGVTATERREGEEEIDIVVRGDPDLTRVSRDAVEDIAVPTTRGVPVPLSTVADITEETGTSVVRRRDREHTITITGDLDEQYAGEIPTPVEMASELAQRFDDIPDNYPGVDLEVGGEAEATQETFGSLNVALQFAVLIIFGLLVIQFNSLGQPFAVLCAIPIGLVGVVAGMLIMGETLSISGMVGVVALAGVAINDSLVFVDFANQARAANPGLSMRDAVIEAGKIRLRPIFLTTLSTIGALLPMAIGLGGKSPMWAPLAITIIFGLLATTPFILFFGPSLLLVIDWLEGAVGNLLKPILPRHDPRDDDL
jgi:HAE1 family hydrophobic/amphiphilic exporter-1